MKFRAAFSDVGVGWLERRFLPLFERLAPHRELLVALLLTPDACHVIYDGKAAGGPEIHVDFAVRRARGRAGAGAGAALFRVAPRGCEGSEA